MSVVREQLGGTDEGRAAGGPVGDPVVPRGRESLVPPWVRGTGALSLATRPGGALERYSATHALFEEVEELLGEWQVSGIRVADASALWGYLLRHPGLVSVVRDMLREARARFPEARAAVCLDRDPEGSDDEYVSIRLRFPAYPEDCLEKIRKLEERFLAQLRSGGGWVVLTTDFGPVDGRMVFDWREFVALGKWLAGTGLGSVPGVSAEATQRTVVGRVYYAAFGYLMDRAAARGYKPRRTAEDHRALRESLRGQGREQLAANLDRLRQWRNSCDYEG